MPMERVYSKCSYCILSFTTERGMNDHITKKHKSFIDGRFKIDDTKVEVMFNVCR